MTESKPSSHGIVVDHRESGVRYAVSDANFNPQVHRRVRDLKPGESVLGYRPKGSSSGSSDGTGSAALAGPGTGTQEDDHSSVQEDGSQTEGSASAGTKGK